MPLYTVHHAFPLYPEQRSALATAITSLHCTTFRAPSIFVNVTFHPATPTFIGGREVQSNAIIAHMRPRPNKAPGTLDNLTLELLTIWDQVFNTSGWAIPGSIQNPEALHTVFIMEDIVSGAEQGFLLPTAGNDEAWVQQNIDEFEKRAEEGDEGMKVLVKESEEGLGKGRPWGQEFGRRGSQDTLVQGD
ncbi:hypothetical protein BCR34DRAFT_498303 [Clohesyomyces aquaticus]|uniref:Tautomerase cis-CaaD-like domain-containing protein n=1 Tax=Clohesyomyces aquaticus TaxID=1231657 RepID=A0A1Y1YCP6_9PLEO|nr:hypothetical protein BCR34DRAFT_498303 [Clohesyomyces aquaticus]